MDFDVKYDVAVIGGGIAGVAAALQAARSGKKTVLVEKTILLGGLATSGLVYIYLPLCDGNGHQVTFGLCEELIRKSIQYGPGKIPEHWQDGKNAREEERFRCIFSPAAFMLALDEAVQEAGIDVWFDTLVCGAEVNGNRLTGAIVENESGRGVIHAKRFVDASGSSILARRAGVPCLDENNYLSIWAIEYRKDANPEGENLGKNVAVCACGAWANGGTSMSDRELARAGLTREMLRQAPYRGISGRKVSEYVLRTRNCLREHFLTNYESGKYDRNSNYALKLPVMPQFRKIYCIKGEYVLKENEHATFFEDSIGLLADWRKAGFVWEIPYRTLYPENRLGGLLAAGRCSAASGDAWEVTRVIPSAAMTGQVAGLAAALSIDENVEPADLNVPLLQTELRKLGFPLHLADVGL